MDVSAMIEIVQGVGFPIGVTIFLLYYMKTEMTENRKALTELKLVITTLYEFLRNERKV
jgi:uncharacterized membrane protein YciS (DUF1049 family)